MELSPFEVSELISAKKLGILSDEGETKLDHWRSSSAQHEELFQTLISNNIYEQDVDWAFSLPVHEVIEKAKSKITFERPNPFHLFIKKYGIAIAACTIAALFILLWNLKLDHTSLNIVPGSFRASIQLEDGKSLQLPVEKKYFNISEELKKITSNNPLKQGKTLIISTPKGGQYHILLPDGSSVRLNAASTLIFPEEFDGKQRTVKLIGEAFFEISKIKNGDGTTVPFFVQCNEQEIQVLGTKFNVSSYSEDKSTITTLMEGSVKINYNSTDTQEGIILKPNEQAISTPGQNTYKREVDNQSDIAWTKDQFEFVAEPLESVMVKLARWYDFDFEFIDQKLRKVKIEGIIPRYASAEDLFKLLSKASNANFIVEKSKVKIN
ncbi:FecR family protein [Sphingobacterium detergens]